MPAKVYSFLSESGIKQQFEGIYKLRHYNEHIQFYLAKLIFSINLLLQHIFPKNLFCSYPKFHSLLVSFYGWQIAIGDSLKSLDA
jgi:hypothetical protein